MIEKKIDLREISRKILSRRIKSTYPSVLVDNKETIKQLLQSEEQFTPVEIYNAIDKKGQRLSYNKFKQFIKEELGISLMSDDEKRQRRIKFIIAAVKADPQIREAVRAAFKQTSAENQTDHE
jgi:Cu2+-containing amine oxidase